MLSNIEIGSRINSTRDLRGLTLDDVASRVGVAKSTISRYENGTIAKIKLPVIESIAHVLEVDPNWLIGNTDDPRVAAPSRSLSWDQQELLDNYNQLNEEGQEDLRRHARVMVRSGEYTRRPLDVLDKKA